MESAITIHSGATKWDIRQRVWDYIEENNLANFPRPVHNRIPNFKGAFTASAKVSELQAYTLAAEVKVDPDKPLEGVRLAVLQAKKELLVPTPRLRSGLFNRITPPQEASKEQLRVCSTSQGVKEFSVPVGLDATVKIDLVVVGSVAVSEKGYRIGKGEGYADLEYGMMVSMGAVTESTVVVTVVHDCQVVDIPEELLENHDLTVDYILTPTCVIKTDCQRPKPQGIIWAKLDTDKLEKIPVLKKLRALEEEAGKDVTLGTAPVEGEPGFQVDRKPKRQNRRRQNQSAQPDAEGDAKEESRQENREPTEQRPRPRRRPARVRKDSRGDYSEDGGVEGREGGEGEGKDGGKGQDGKKKERPSEPREREAMPQRKLPMSVTTVYLGGIPAGLRVSELKTALREREAAPLRLTWQGAQHRAFLDYIDQPTADRALEALQGLSLNGQDLLAELAKSQRGGKRAGAPNRRPRPPAAPKPTKASSESGGDTHENTPQ